MDTKERVAVCETKIDNLGKEVALIRTNHLPHIHQEIKDVRQENKNNFKWIVSLVVLGILIPILLFIIT